MRTTILKRAASLSLFLVISLTACGSRYGKPATAGSQLAFGVDMARRGLWSEALFRFHQAAQAEPQNARVMNNLGVAYEATGDYDKALSFYQQALKIEPNNRELRANYGRFVEFYQAYKGKEGKDKGTGATPATTTAPPAAPPAAEETPPPPAEEPEARPPA
ncbi:MAG TPA: tetratricopeptide repeat protein [Thermoanaerobaculia bacterium]